MIQEIFFPSNSPTPSPLLVQEQGGGVVGRLIGRIPRSHGTLQLDEERSFNQIVMIRQSVAESDVAVVIATPESERDFDNGRAL